MEQNKPESTIPFLRSLRTFLPLLPILGVVIAFTLSAGLVLSFDDDIGHFKNGSAAFYVMTAGIILSAAVSAVLGKRSRGKFSLTAYPDSVPLSVCASYFTAFMACVTSAASLYDIYVLNLRTGGTLELLAAFFFLAVPVSMILGSHEKTRHSIVRIVFALLSVLAVNFNMFACYFDFTLPLNSAVRNLITIAQAGSMLFLLSEVRLALSPETRATAPFLLFTSAFAASAVLGISFGLCVYGFVSPDAAGMGISVYRFASYFGIGLLALSRLLSLNSTGGTYVAPPEPEKESGTTEQET